MDDDRDSEQVEEEGRPAIRSGRVRIIGAEQADPTLSVPVAGVEGDERTAGGGDDRIGPAEVPAEGPKAGTAPALGGSAEPDLPHWTEAPTGEVPAVLARGSGEHGREPDPWSSLPAPTWREDGVDWDADIDGFEPSMLAQGEPGIRARGESEEAERQPWSFDLPDHEEAGPGRAQGDAAMGIGDEETLVAPLDSLGATSGPPVGPAPGSSVATSPGDRDVPGRRGRGDVADGGGEAGDAPGGPGSVDAYDDELHDHPDEGERDGDRVRGRRRRRRPLHGGAAAGAAAAERFGGGPEAFPAGGTEDLDEPVPVGDVDDGVETLAGDDPTVAGEGGLEPPRGRGGRMTGRARRGSGPPPTGRGGPTSPEAGGPSSPEAGGPTPTSRRPGPVRRRPGPLRPPQPVSERPGPSRSMPAAAATGVVLLLVVVVAFRLGTVPAAIISTGVLFLAAAEAFAAFRKAGYQPATLLGLLASVSLMVATYNKGQAALPLVLVLLVAFTLLWFMGGVQPGADPVQGTGSTLFVFCWVGVLGSFAALLLNPNLFPDRHGIAFLLGAIITSVACDVGALVVGNRIGRHPLAPTISPNKTWEGVIGGAVASVLAAVIVVHFIHPWTLGKAVALGVVVAVVSPIGDLCESLVKRQLGVKDMGRLLPGHGGLLDRIDGLLFVLPATYYLVKAVHLG